MVIEATNEGPSRVEFAETAGFLRRIVHVRFGTPFARAWGVFCGRSSRTEPRRTQETEQMPFRVLVVNADPAARSDMERMLSTAGNLVTSVAEFDEAQQRLVYAPPDLLVTGVRLGSHNGLHLVLRAHAERPDTPAIVVHTAPDPVLEIEAINAGASYMTTPLDEEQFVSLVEDLLSGTPSLPSSTVPRRWPRKQVEVFARVGNNLATVVDVSYGGLPILNMRPMSGAGSSIRSTEVVVSRQNDC